MSSCFGGFLMPRTSYPREAGPAVRQGQLDTAKEMYRL